MTTLITASAARRPRTYRRRNTVLIFDPAQKVPEAVLKAITDEWLVPCLVEEFFADRRKPYSPAHEIPVGERKVAK